MLELVLENMPVALIAVGLVLMTLEALSPGAHLIVIGISLVGAGLVGLLFGIGAPLVLAALVLAFGAVSTYVYREFDFYGGRGSGQTLDSSSLSGRTGYVTETVTSRGGQVKLEGGGFNPYYSARTTSGTIGEGEEVLVLDPGGGNVLTVAELGAVEEDEIDRALAREPTDDDELEDASVGDLDDDDPGTDDGDDHETETEPSR